MLALETHQNIIQKAQMLLSLIQDTEEYKRFTQAEAKLEKHGDAQALMFVVRAKRNSYSQISLRHGYDHPRAIQAKKDYDEALEQVSQIPLIDEYQVLQEELNDLLQGILRTVVNTISPVIEVEIGEDMTIQKKGGCSGNCSGCKTSH